MSQITFTIPPGGLHVVNADGSGSRTLTSGPNDYNPAWSPDGSSVVFQRRSQSGNWDLYLVRWDGSALEPLATGPEPEEEPAWSPDGGRIAFVRSGSIHVMNVDGSGITPLTNTGLDSHPSWSPDGTQIVFGSGRSGVEAIHIMDADGSGVVQLTSDPAGDSNPSWSPDGTKIAFERGDADVYLVNPDGSGLTRVVSGQTPVWSPDSRRILYEWFGMNVILTDGSGLTRLGTGFDPDWSAVGTMPPEPVSFRSVSMASGDGQTGTVGTTLALPLSVRVLRDDGTPEAGAAIRWNRTGDIGGSLSSSLGTTDASGTASVSVTLGVLPGTFGVRAALVDGTAHTAEVVFTATAASGQPARFIRFSSDSQLNAVGTSGVYMVSALDSHDNPVPVGPVSWTVVNGGGTITPLPDTTIFGYPIARAAHTFGPDEGMTMATATAPGIVGSPTVSFTTTVVTAVVVINNYFSNQRFTPDAVVVASGRTVGWRWQYSPDSEDSHIVTFEDDPNTVHRGRFPQFFTRTLTGVPRTIRYRCTEHSTDFVNGEVGVVIVQ